MMNLDQIREGSWAEAARLGYPVNPALPLLDVDRLMRGSSETAQRLLALHAVAASSYGFDKHKAQLWLEREGLIEALTPDEATFLGSTSSAAQNARMQWRVEALWTLAWSLSFHDQLDFADSCSDDFVTMLPDLRIAPPAQPFLERAEIRDTQAVIEKCDLAYCLHWGAREAALASKAIPNAIPEAAISERRLALEWLVDESDWDEISLDT